MDVHLRDLRYFVAVAEELNVTRAAERLFISQPALSKQLRALESQLGFDLIDRSARSIRLTPAGAALAAGAPELLKTWSELEAGAHGAAAQLTIGMQTALGRGLQKTVLATLTARGISASWRQVGWDDPLAGLADGCDLSFAWLPLPDTVRTAVLASEPRYVAFCCEHRFADAAAVRTEELRDQAFVALPQSSPAARDYWLARDDDRPVQVAATAASADEAFELVASGVGVMLLAEGNTRLYARPGVEYRPVEDLSPARLALAWVRPELDRLAAVIAGRAAQTPA